MCSVVGCDSFRLGVHRFKLPEDPERRLVWVQFLFEVNGQRLKESSWTDITICCEHFTDDSFESLTPGTDGVQLKPDAVPSLCVKSEPEDPVESPQNVVEPEEAADAVRQCDGSELSCSPTSCNEKSACTLTDAISSASCQEQQKVQTPCSTKETVTSNIKGKYVVNENCLLELLGRNCPSCGSNVQVEKVSYGELIALIQRCQKCDSRNRRKSQVDSDVPNAEDRLTGGSEATLETQQAAPTDDSSSSAILSEAVTFSDGETDPSGNCEGGDEGEVVSDEEWNPTELGKESEEEEEEEDSDPPGGLKINELCTECGSFFSVLKPHICEHKEKPYWCNICGKRCISEKSLTHHSRNHSETYEHPCKYCYVTFKTRVDKHKHENTHQDRKDPYKCPDCPETFPTSKKRSIHLAKHRAPKEFRCGVCQIEFKDVHHLRRHSVVHTGLKPYKCSVCQRGFNQSSNLKSHMRLHTGERPFKCQHCDKSFNHNVSLKSHVQRYHSSGSARQRKKGKYDEKTRDAADAEGNGKTMATDSECDSADEDLEEEVQKERGEKPDRTRRSTGRPKGRPKRNAAGNLVQTEEMKDQLPNSRKAKLKTTGSNQKETEDEQSGSDLSLDSAEEEETARKSGQRQPKKDSESYFDAEETKKKRYSREKSRGGVGRGKTKTS
ncbi:zinc finger protein 485-like [Mugil cephalus]|uniref:zinc finger protein 485-like n=1 Tax=Mugil cephalus TaxID=48193 RepID=UPI001FB69F87|nr:zinc finger protein 485-like [Mugil cephalus]